MTTGKGPTRIMPAGEFKARGLRVMEDVRKYRTPVVITKKGRPVAKLVPADEPATDVCGCLAATARIVGDIEAPLVPLEAWTAVGRARAASPSPRGRRAVRRR